ncbi:MAG: 4Fe-4S binding protein [Desulfovibrionaceae bacterium]|nr:4Fe-4S binding protein [Desulfovibrionaceae bacterium]MBF0513197.1 4Fe-4S binding protein [Desulfovibrionaceae bacterium]
MHSSGPQPCFPPRPGARVLDAAAYALPPACAVLLAAHALRPGNPGLALSCLVLGLLALTRQAFARLVLAPGLAAGALIWAGSGLELVRMRLALGEPHVRLAAIMAALAVLNLAGALVLIAAPGKRRFDKRPELAAPLAAVFLITLGALYTLQYFLRPPHGPALLLAERFAPTSGWLEATLIACYAAFAAARLLRLKTQAATRSLIWRLFSLVFFLQLALGLLGLPAMLMTGALHLPVPALIVAGPLYRGHGLFMLWLFSASVVLLGPGWCSHLCYIGAWDDLAAKSKKLPSPLPRWAVSARAAILGLTLAAPLFLRFLDVSLEAALWTAAAFGLTGLGVMALASARLGTMAHCTAFCPIGLLGNLLAKLTPWRLRVSLECTRCTACISRCRYNALTLERLESGKPALSCTLCGDCLSACKHDALHYRFLNLSPARSRTLFVVLAASLHAIFLAVARI